MEKHYSEEDKKIIKMLSKTFGITEKEVESRYIPMSDKAKESISIKTVFPIKKKKSKQEKIKEKYDFLKEVMCTSIAVQGENGTRIDYMISDSNLREDLQYKVMTLVQEYLK